MGTALAAVVSVLSFYLDHQSSTRAKVYSFYFVADARKE